MGQAGNARHIGAVSVSVVHGAHQDGTRTFGQGVDSIVSQQVPRRGLPGLQRSNTDSGIRRAGSRCDRPARQSMPPRNRDSAEQAFMANAISVASQWMSCAMSQRSSSMSSNQVRKSAQAFSSLRAKCASTALRVRVGSCPNVAVLSHVQLRRAGTQRVYLTSSFTTSTAGTSRAARIFTHDELD